MDTYTAGNTIQLAAVFTDPTNGNAPFDPATVVFSVMGPNSRVVSTPSVTRDAVGMYHADVVANDEGLWQYVASGITPACATHGSFVVKPQFGT